MYRSFMMALGLIGAAPALAQTGQPAPRTVTPPAAAAPAASSPRAAQPPVAAVAAPQAAASAAPAAATPPRNWVVSCGEASAGRARDCRLSATAALQPQNQRLLTATLQRQPETRSLVLVFQAAHGAALPAGLAWQIDDGEVQRLAFQTADAEGIYTGVPVADDLLTTLRLGRVLRVSFVLAARREGVTVGLPLAEFGEAITEFFAAERQATP